MKKYFMSILVLNLIIFELTGCYTIQHEEISNYERITKNIELNDYNCKIEREKDTHAGFFGDGEYFAKMSCLKINYGKISKNWKELPLSKSLNKFTERNYCQEEKGCSNFYQHFKIPNIEDGYYYFLDRHSESKNKYNDSDLMNRYSYNFTLAIIDKKNNTIYYYEIDT